MKLAWLTDPHLNCALRPAHHKLAGELSQLAPDALLVTGDVHEAPGVLGALDWLALYARCPVYFVLGNHDFYRCASIPALRAQVSAHCAAHDALRYMPDHPFITLAPGTALVGHDGWGDALAGAPLTTSVMLADFYAIPELAGLARPALIAKLNTLGDEAAMWLEGALKAALVDHQHVIALLHVPPFVQAAWHEGAQSNDDWAPYFVCVAAGEVLLRVAAAHPERRITVLCGHTHGCGELWPLPNLHVRTGGAEYGAPRLQAPLRIV